MQTKNFTVYKSSAGSGKTFTLVKEYLKIVLSDPYSFKYVLAITFTNKAANEMKQRIINSLLDLSDYNPEKCSSTVKFMFLDLLKETNLTEQMIKSNAAKTLELILHDYSEFGVSTIDSFVYKIIKSFAFDLNIPLNFEVELDANLLLEKAIAILISKTGKNEKLTRFLVEFVQNRIEEEKNWNIEYDLLKISKLILSEDSRENINELQKLSLDDFVRINNHLSASIKAFETKGQSLGAKAIEIIDSAGLTSAAFYYAKTGIYGYFSYLNNRRFDKLHPNSYVLKTIHDDKWCAAKISNFDKVEVDRLKPDLIQLYNQIEDLLETGLENYIVYSELRKNLYPLAIIGEVSQILDEYKHENDLLLISEFNQKIADIVLNESIPFIYERVGEKFNNFMLDEFQDTSILQWQNIIPLIDNSIAKGYRNLLVGDGKQSIYRWRSGEVEQFASLPEIYKKPLGQIHNERENTLITNYSEKSLDHNFRSKPEIVAFNNDFFVFHRKSLAEKYQKIYLDVEQSVSAGSEGGFVNIEFHYPTDDDLSFEEFNCIHVEQHIKECIDDGFSFRDIAILCRSKKSASIMAQYLIKQNIQVVSSESLLLANSTIVRLIINLLRVINNPQDKIGIVELLNKLVKLNKIEADFQDLVSGLLVKNKQSENRSPDYGIFELLTASTYHLNRKHLISLPLYDLCEELIRIFHLEKNGDAYLQYFLDCVLERSLKTEADIGDFLQWWEEKKSELSIIEPEGNNSVNIMTIHKAKGLEFPVVFYPFANERLKNTLDKIWVSTENYDIPELKTALINPVKIFSETQLSKNVEIEENKSLLDFFNLLYVVFTRPTDRLYILSSKPPAKKDAALSVTVLLKEYLMFKELWQENQAQFSFGNRTKSDIKQKRIDNTYRIDQFISNNWINRAQLSYQSPDNRDTYFAQSEIEWGNIIHLILSQIECLDDLPEVIENFVIQGIISTDIRNDIEKELSEFLEHEKIKKYFEKGLSVLREKEILLPSAKSFRPDRIILGKDYTNVIDFKTGKPQSSHIQQMRTYLDLVTQMQLVNPMGVLLYISNPEVVEVTI